MPRVAPPSWIENVDYIRCACGNAVEKDRVLALLTPMPTGCMEFSGRIDNGYGKLCHIWIHRYVWQITNGPIAKGMEIRHTCDNPPCANPRHLLIGTHAQNMGDASERNRMHGPVQPLTGEKNPHSKLTETDIVAIRSAVADGNRRADVAHHFGTCLSNVSQIVKRKRWAHVQ